MNIGLSHGRLREVLNYDQETGVFTWKISRCTNGKASVGSVAGFYPKNGYRQIEIDRVRYLAHRLAWLYVYGTWPADGIDHKDGIRDHNWINNLRSATQSENAANRRRYANNSSGFKGVSYRQQARKGVWLAHISKDGKSIYVGTFQTPELAHAGYLSKANELFGDFACGGETLHDIATK